MQIRCNGRMHELAEGVSLAEFVALLGLDSATLVAECDGTIVGREDFDRFMLQDGMVLELIRFVGGG